MTQVLVVLAFRVDIFTIACSFLSCSIRDLRKQGKSRWYNQPVKGSIRGIRNGLHSHVLLLKQLDLLLQLHVVCGTDGNPATHTHKFTHLLAFC